MKSKILFTIFILMLAVVAFLAYQVIQERYYSAEEDSEEEQTSLSEETENDLLDEPEADVPEEEEAETEDAEEEATETDVERDRNGRAIINKMDCSDNCEKFKSDKEDFKYCKQICGFFPIIKKESRAECADLSGNEKDFCLRDLAVTKQDFRICDEISNKEIKDACNNRLIEDVFDDK